MKTANPTNVSAVHSKVAAENTNNGPLRLVVNNLKTEERKASVEPAILIYDRPIFRAKKHDPF